MNQPPVYSMFVSLCENSNMGQRRGRVTSIDFHNGMDYLFTLEAGDMLDGEAVISSDTEILLYNCKVPVIKMQPWAGSMHFNGYLMAARHALSLIHTIQEHKNRWMWRDGQSNIYYNWQFGKINSRDLGFDAEIEPEFINVNQLSFFK